MQKRLVSCSEIAARYDVDKGTVRRWCREGRVLAEVTPGGCWRVRVDENGNTITPK